MARLATADENGSPHIIPVCFTFDGCNIYSALDLKPKRVLATQLKRVRNIKTNPKVAFIVDDYLEDWSQLAYVLIRGHAVLITGDHEQHQAEKSLRYKYPQYKSLLQEGCTVIKITPEQVTTWGTLVPGTN